MRSVALIIMLVGLAWVGPASAQAPLAQAATLEAALEVAWESAEGEQSALGALLQAGAKPDRLLIAEVTPDNRGVVVEVGVEVLERRVRVPLKFKRSEPRAGATWRLAWQPDVAWARALLDAMRAEELPRGEGGAAWYGAARLPALPVIVGDGAVITPFGRGSLEAPARPDASGSLAPAAAAVDAAQRWVGLILGDDPAPAAVDLWVQPDVSWKVFSRVIMGVSASGLFRLNIMHLDGRGQPVSVPAAAPIFGAPSDQAAPLIIAVDAEAAEQRFRVRLGDEEATSASACRPGVSFCAATDEEFRERLTRTVGALAARVDARVAYVLLAAGGSMTVEQGLRLARLVPEALGMSPAKLVLGYVDDAGPGAQEAP